MSLVLKHLNLDSRGLTEIPHNVKTHAELEILSAYNNQLHALPEWLFSLKNLKFLNLGHNKFTTVSPDLAKLASLETLDLGHNQIRVLPDELGELKNLSGFLYLNNNQLESIPTSICNLKKLKYEKIKKFNFTIFDF